MNDFKERLQKRIADVEEGFQPFLPKEEGIQKILWQAMNYSFLAGGKRIRPILMYETFKMLGGTDDTLVQPFMAALEMIHTYSLVHDDLPVMDDDDYRRGRLTTHKVYGEDMAVLAGDGLLNFAFETAFKAFGCEMVAERDAENNGESENRSRCVAAALKILAEKAGGYGMVGGQVVDVEMTGKPLSEDLLFFIYEKKTSALIEASMMIGAVLAGTGKEEICQMEKIAKKIGLAFQIQDDILDITGDEVTIGKPIFSDEKNKKTTFVTLYGEEEARKTAWKYSREAILQLQNILQKNSSKSEFLQEIVEFLMNRDK